MGDLAHHGEGKGEEGKEIDFDGLF